MLSASRVIRMLGCQDFAREDAIRICQVQRSKLIQREVHILREVRDVAVSMQRAAVRQHHAGTRETRPDR